MPGRTSTKAARAGSSKKTAAPAKASKQKADPYAGIQLTTRRDVEQGTYTAQRSERLRAGNIS